MGKNILISHIGILPFGIWKFSQSYEVLNVSNKVNSWTVKLAEIWNCLSPRPSPWLMTPWHRNDPRQAAVPEFTILASTSCWPGMSRCRGCRSPLQSYNLNFKRRSKMEELSRFSHSVWVDDTSPSLQLCCSYCILSCLCLHHQRFSRGSKTEKAKGSLR